MRGKVLAPLGLWAPRLAGRDIENGPDATSGRWIRKGWGHSTHGVAEVPLDNDSELSIGSLARTTDQEEPPL